MAITILLVALFALGASEQKGVDDGILRIRGIVIEDATGRDRILIGAPIPHSNHRIRDDMKKVEKAWGKRFPDMKWFKDLDSSTTGVIILDENGYDRVVVGAPTPDPNVGRRRSPSIGFVVNDEEGFERSGWGYSEDGSVGLGLDHKSGEGLNLFIMPDGTNGILIREEGGKRSTFVGHAKAKHTLTGMDQPLQGILLRDENGPHAILNAAANPPSLELRDEKGRLLRN